MKKFLFLTLILIGNFAVAGTFPTTSYVDVQRYVGKWYAITSLPQFFSKSCLSQTAEYKVLSENSVSVLNTCYKKNGKMSTISGKAVIVNPSTNAELEVTFDNFFTRLFKVKGDYNIIKLDPDYEFVMVGSKDRKSLWIMSRSTHMPSEVLQEYVQFADEIGFDITKLVESKF